MPAGTAIKTIVAGITGPCTNTAIVMLTGIVMPLASYSPIAKAYGFLQVVVFGGNVGRM